jgi:hypothetical protein
VTRALLSPFVTPRAGEIVLERAFDDIEPLVVVRGLMEQSRFAAWVRPHVYDSMNGAEDHCAAGIGEALDRHECAAIIASPPAGTSAEGYCPRCGATYRDERLTCPDCGTVALVHE